MKDFYLRISLGLGRKIPVELSVGYIENKIFYYYDNMFKCIKNSDYTTSKIGLNNKQRIFIKINPDEVFKLFSIYDFKNGIVETETSVDYTNEFLLKQGIVIDNIRDEVMKKLNNFQIDENLKEFLKLN